MCGTIGENMPFMDKIKTWNGATLLIGSATLACWVIFRFFTKSINFDLVGQQLLARQWLDGNFEGSIIGPTNYIFKIIFLYMPAELLGVDQKVFIAASAIAVNVVTFIGMYIVLKKILRYFSIEPSTFFNLAMLWLVAVAGSVFWVQFTNSRNIELLAGLVLLYLGLLLYKKISLFTGVWFVLLAGITYFSDPLQLFVVSAALIVYVASHSLLYERQKRKEVLLIVALVALGYVISKLLVFLAQEITGAELIAVSTRPQFQELVAHLPLVVVETIKNGIRLLAGTNEMGVWRQALNMAIVGLSSFLALMTLVKEKAYVKHRSLMLFVAVLLAVPVAVYVASGQPLFKADTSRYLIALAPAFVILFSVIDMRTLPERITKTATAALAALLCISIGALFLATFQQRGGQFMATSHLEDRYGYLEANNYQYGYASMDTAIPSMYFLARNKGQVLLPLSCEHGVLRKATLFYDRRIFTKAEGGGARVPIILDGDSITNYPSVCSLAEIKQQLGEPIAIESQNGNVVLIYEASTINRPSF